MAVITGGWLAFSSYFQVGVPLPPQREERERKEDICKIHVIVRVKRNGVRQRGGGKEKKRNKTILLIILTEHCIQAPFLPLHMQQSGRERKRETREREREREGEGEGEGEGKRERSYNNIHNSISLLPQYIAMASHTNPQVNSNDRGCQHIIMRRQILKGRYTTHT